MTHPTGRDLSQAPRLSRLDYSAGPAWNVNGDMCVIVHAYARTRIVAPIIKFGTLRLLKARSEQPNRLSLNDKVGGNDTGGVSENVSTRACLQCAADSSARLNEPRINGGSKWRRFNLFVVGVRAAESDHAATESLPL